MKLFLFIFLMLLPFLRKIIFSLNLNFLLKHIFWNFLKWTLAILIILNVKLNFNFSLMTIFYGVLLFLISVFYFIISTIVLNYKSVIKGLSEIYKLNIVFRILGALSAGFTEEIIFRGFLVLFLNDFLNNLFLSCLISALIFGAFHIPLWGLLGSLQISIWSILLYLYLIQKNEILALIIAHSLNDLFFFLSKYKLIQPSLKSIFL